MGSFKYDGENGWFNVVGKGNKAAKISVRDEYIEAYLKRYRTTLSLPPFLPSPFAVLQGEYSTSHNGQRSSWPVRSLHSCPHSEGVR